MKKRNFITLCLIVSASICQSQTFQNTTPTATADATSRLSSCGFGTDPGVQMNEITVPLTGAVLDPSKITIEIGLNATFLGDVVVDIVSPSGDAITLIKRIGALESSNCGSYKDFVSTNILSFNSINTLPIDVTGASVPAGNYAPTIGLSKYPTHNPIDMNSFLMGKEVGGNWRIILYDYGVGDPSNIDSWKISFGPGATLIAHGGGDLEKNISVHPNPAEDYLQINIPGNFKNTAYEIHDTSGNLILKENGIATSDDFQIDVRELSSGVYLLFLVNEGEPQKEIRFIKK